MSAVNNRQEINLYLPRLRPQIDYLSPVNVGKGLAALVVVFLVITVMGYWENSAGKQQISVKKNEVAALERLVSEKTSGLPQDSGKLDRQIEERKDDIKHLRAVGHIIAGQVVGNAEGFSAQLDDLARHSTSRLSLTAFELDQGGLRVALRGLASGAHDVPLYIEKLRATNSFADSGFGPLRIERDAGVLQFFLNHDEDGNDG